MYSCASDTRDFVSSWKRDPTSRDDDLVVAQAQLRSVARVAKRHDARVTRIRGLRANAIENEEDEGVVVDDDSGNDGSPGGFSDEEERMLESRRRLETSPLKHSRPNSASRMRPQSAHSHCSTEISSRGVGRPQSANISCRMSDHKPRDIAWMPQVMKDSKWTEMLQSGPRFQQQNLLRLEAETYALLQHVLRGPSTRRRPRGHQTVDQQRSQHLHATNKLTNQSAAKRKTNVKKSNPASCGGASTGPVAVGSGLQVARKNNIDATRASTDHSNTSAGQQKRGSSLAGGRQVRSAQASSRMNLSSQSGPRNTSTERPAVIEKTKARSKSAAPARKISGASAHVSEKDSTKRLVDTEADANLMRELGWFDESGSREESAVDDTHLRKPKKRVAQKNRHADSSLADEEARKTLRVVASSRSTDSDVRESPCASNASSVPGRQSLPSLPHKSVSSNHGVTSYIIEDLVLVPDSSTHQHEVTMLCSKPPPPELDKERIPTVGSTVAWDVLSDSCGDRSAISAREDDTTLAQQTSCLANTFTVDEAGSEVSTPNMPLDGDVSQPSQEPSATEPFIGDEYAEDFVDEETVLLELQIEDPASFPEEQENKLFQAVVFDAQSESQYAVATADEESLFCPPFRVDVENFKPHTLDTGAQQSGFVDEELRSSQPHDNATHYANTTQAAKTIQRQYRLFSRRRILLDQVTFLSRKRRRNERKNSRDVKELVTKESNVVHAFNNVIGTQNASVNKETSAAGLNSESETIYEPQEVVVDVGDDEAVKSTTLALDGLPSLGFSMSSIFKEVDSVNPRSSDRPLQSQMHPDQSRDVDDENELLILPDDVLGHSRGQIGDTSMVSDVPPKVPICCVASQTYEINSTDVDTGRINTMRDFTERHEIPSRIGDQDVYIEDRGIHDVPSPVGDQDVYIEDRGMHDEVSVHVSLLQPSAEVVNKPTPIEFDTPFQQTTSKPGGSTQTDDHRDESLDNSVERCGVETSTDAVEAAANAVVAIDDCQLYVGDPEDGDFVVCLSPGPETDETRSENRDEQGTDLCDVMGGSQDGSALRTIYPDVQLATVGAGDASKLIRRDSSCLTCAEQSLDADGVTNTASIELRPCQVKVCGDRSTTEARQEHEISRNAALVKNIATSQNLSATDGTEGVVVPIDGTISDSHDIVPDLFAIETATQAVGINQEVAVDFEGQLVVIQDEAPDQGDAPAQRDAAAHCIQQQYRRHIYRRNLLDQLSFSVRQHRRESRKKSRRISTGQGTVVTAPLLGQTDQPSLLSQVVPEHSAVQSPLLQATETDTETECKSLGVPIEVSVVEVPVLQESLLDDPDLAALTSPLVAPRDLATTWERYMDSNTNKSFYYNPTHQLSQWHRPVDIPTNSVVDRTVDQVAATEPTDASPAGEQDPHDVHDDQSNSTNTTGTDVPAVGICDRWERYMDSATNKSFYVNAACHISQWERPHEMAATVDVADATHDSASDDTNTDWWRHATHEATVLETFGGWERCLAHDSVAIFYHHVERDEYTDGTAEPEAFAAAKHELLHATSTSERWTLRRNSSVCGDRRGEWQAFVDPETHQTFYYNTRSGESSWDQPSAFTEPQPTTSAVGRYEWVMYVDAATAQPYYVNILTNATSWDKPADFDAAMTAHDLSRLHGVGEQRDVLMVATEVDAQEVSYSPMEEDNDDDDQDAYVISIHDDADATEWFAT